MKTVLLECKIVHHLPPPAPKRFISFHNIKNFELVELKYAFLATTERRLVVVAVVDGRVPSVRQALAHVERLAWTASDHEVLGELRAPNGIAPNRHFTSFELELA